MNTTMNKNDFMKSYEEVMGCPLTWKNLAIGGAMMAAFILILVAGDALARALIFCF